MKKIVIRIVICILICCIIYIAIECINGIRGNSPFIILKKEKIRDDSIITEINYGLIFSNYNTYSSGFSTGWHIYENKLFNLITIWKQVVD